MSKKQFRGLGFLMNSTPVQDEVVCSLGNLYVKKSSVFGAGVFAKIDFAVGDTIEVAPIIEFDGKTNRIFDHTPVISNIRCSYPSGYEYAHKNKEVTGGGFIALGYGSVYKGESGGIEGNALMQFKVSEDGTPAGAAVITAAKPVPKNTEIIIKQNWDSRVADTDISNTFTILDRFFQQEEAITKTFLPILIKVNETIKVIGDGCLPKIAEASKQMIEKPSVRSEIDIVSLGNALAVLVEQLNKLNELMVLNDDKSE